MRHASKRFSSLAAFTFCALSLATLAPGASAEDGYLLVKAGAYSPESSDLENDVDTGFNGEIAIGQYFLPFLGGELGVGYFESSKGGNKLTVYPVTLAAKLRLPIPVIKPYGLLGGGAYISKAEISGLGSSSDTAFGYFGGAGLDVKVLFVLLNVEAKYLWANPTFFGAETNIDGFVATLGVGIEF